MSGIRRLSQILNKLSVWKLMGINYFNKIHTRLDKKKNLDILKELNINPIIEKIQNYRQK